VATQHFGQFVHCVIADRYRGNTGGRLKSECEITRVTAISVLRILKKRQAQLAPFYGDFVK
jgi:hypothetical protein